MNPKAHAGARRKTCCENHRLCHQPFAFPMPFDLCGEISAPVMVSDTFQAIAKAQVKWEIGPPRVASRQLPERIITYGDSAEPDRDQHAHGHAVPRPS